MLIDCPKCHSVYKIPDKLIGKTGKKFRCQVCANIWHAMPEDALDYETDTMDEPYIEPILVKEPPHRNYPANKKAYTVPADGKSGRRTKSSKEIIDDEGMIDYTPPKTKKKKEITLTSDQGTSFTINAAPEAVVDDDTPKKTTPHLFSEDEDTDIHADISKRLSLQKPFKGYRKTRFLIFLLILAALFIFLRRDIVTFYPKAETWYNKIRLSGLNNSQYLRFDNITFNKDDNEPNILKLKVDIINSSRFDTRVPAVTVNDSQTKYKPQKNFLKAGDKTSVTAEIPLSSADKPLNLILGFDHP